MMFKRYVLGIVAICFCLLLLPQPSAGATGADGFMDIPWGTARGAVAAKMAELRFPQDPESNVQRDIYEGMFAGRKAYLTFRFINNVFYSGGALFVDTYRSYGDGGNGIIDAYFREFEQQLTAKYGRATKYPYDSALYWEIQEQGVRIVVKLGKNYPAKGGDNGRVFVNYDNKTLYDKEKQRAIRKDL